MARIIARNTPTALDGQHDKDYSSQYGNGAGRPTGGNNTASTRTLEQCFLCDKKPEKIDHVVMLLLQASMIWNILSAHGTDASQIGELPEGDIRTVTNARDPTHYSR